MTQSVACLNARTSDAQPGTRWPHARGWLLQKDTLRLTEGTLGTAIPPCIQQLFSEEGGNGSATASTLQSFQRWITGPTAKAESTERPQSLIAPATAPRSWGERGEEALLPSFTGSLFRARHFWHRPGRPSPLVGLHQVSWDPHRSPAQAHAAHRQPGKGLFDVSWDRQGLCQEQHWRTPHGMGAVSPSQQHPTRTSAPWVTEDLRSFLL